MSAFVWCLLLPIVVTTGIGFLLLSRWVRSLARWNRLVALTLVLYLLVSFPSIILFTLAGSELSGRMAYELRPPEYPGSVALERWIGGGPRLEWDRATYLTKDDPRIVLDFYEKQMPGFTKHDKGELGIWYVNSRCNSNPLALVFAWLVDPDVSLPCADVSIRQNQGYPSSTEYQIWVEWSSE